MFSVVVPRVITRELFGRVYVFVVREIVCFFMYFFIISNSRRTGARAMDRVFAKKYVQLHAAANEN